MQDLMQDLMQEETPKRIFKLPPQPRIFKYYLVFPFGNKDGFE